MRGLPVLRKDPVYGLREKGEIERVGRDVYQYPESIDPELPLLLGGTLRLAGYPDHMVLAEKIVTAIERGDQNTRWRDFTDIVTIAPTRSISGADLRGAIDRVARYRQVTVEPLGPLGRGYAQPCATSVGALAVRGRHTDRAAYLKCGPLSG